MNKPTFKEGTLLPSTIINIGTSRYLRLPEGSLEYLDMEVGEPVVLKLDRSKRHGRFIGFGKPTKEKR